MTARFQILAAVLLAAATYGVLLRIAETKVETAVGGGAFPLDDKRPDVGRSAEPSGAKTVRSRSITAWDVTAMLPAPRRHGGHAHRRSVPKKLNSAFGRNVALPLGIGIGPCAATDERAENGALVALQND